MKFALFMQLCTISTAGLAANGIVKWGYMEDAEPINWEENGVAKGIEVEIVNYLMAELNLQAEHHFYPWRRAQYHVRHGDLDAMMATPTPSRFVWAVFGRENVLPEYWNIFVPKNRPELISQVQNFRQLEDMRPYSLVDFRGNGWSLAFMAEGYDIHYVPRLVQLPALLTQGRYDMLINSSTWINWWANKQGMAEQLQEIEIDWPWTRFHFVLMVSRKSAWMEKGLIKAMDKAVVKMKESGVWLEILRKYQNPYASGKPFRSHLDDAYSQQQGFYLEYESYPEYIPPK